MLSGNFYIQSGIPFNQLIPHFLYGNNEGFAVPRGTAIIPDLAAINGTSTGAAVRLGKQVGALYVVTGNVVEYNTAGSAIVKVRLVEVATGKVRYTSEFSQQAVTKMYGTGAPEMQAKVMKPLIDKVIKELASEI